MPLVLGPDGARLSKRHGAVAIADLRDAGIRRRGDLRRARPVGGGRGAGRGDARGQLVEGFALERIERRPATLPGLVPGG